MEFSIDDAALLLQRTPAVIDAQLRGLPDDWVHSNEGPDTWSPFEVVGHLIHGEETDWIPRARLILSDAPDKRFTPFDRFAQQRNSAGKTLPLLLDTFARLRTENLDTLRSWNISEADLEKTGIHPEFGSVTLRQLLATWVAHDMTHIVQIARVMGKQYKTDAGPWVQYIGILQR
ncbi:MAG: DinB family protein [Lewinellaceae bacterium]|nr:DinB family protein [Saprospiraceae bacterium]MCB0542935.1 DinB family protein [Saprospiraceae bacterium]MCB9307848.1 DinB family protein [Lewinellaceae bacterium]MCB9353201.1 DinB family protein [Lewinellaceae bacterium]